MAQVLVFDRESGSELAEFKIGLEREQIRSPAGDRRELFTGIAGGDFEDLLEGGGGSWLRIERLPPDGEGSPRSFAMEDWLAGTPLPEEVTITIPVHEGKIPVPAARPGKPEELRFLPGGRIPLKRVVLDRARGSRSGEAPLRPSLQTSGPTTPRPPPAAIPSST